MPRRYINESKTITRCYIDRTSTGALLGADATGSQEDREEAAAMVRRANGWLDDNEPDSIAILVVLDDREPTGLFACRDSCDPDNIVRTVGGQYDDFIDQLAEDLVRQAFESTREFTPGREARWAVL